MRQICQTPAFVEDRARRKGWPEVNHTVCAKDLPPVVPRAENVTLFARGLQIYLMGLVDNPDTSQALKLWRGLDPSWEQVLR